MKLEMKSSSGLIVAMLVVAALGAAFWILLFSPKREEASELGAEVEQLQLSLSQHRAEVAEGEAARKEFPAEYERLVVLGKAVPGDSDTASLLVQVNRIAKRAGVAFDNLELSAAAGGEEAEAPPPASSGGEPVSATEAAASLLPLGASIGPAGLGVMPYNLTFAGSFFEIADFIAGLDALVETDDEEVTVDGRLLTVDGFSLAADPDAGFPALEASFSVTTYLTPAGAGAAEGGLPAEPATAAPVSTTTGGAP